MRRLGTSLWQAGKTLIRDNGLSARAASSVGVFLQLVATLDEDIEGLELHEQVDAVIETSGLLEFHKRDKGDRIYLLVQL